MSRNAVAIAAVAVIGVVLVCFFLLSPASDKMLKQGQEALKQKDYDLAVKCFDEAITSESSKAEAYAGRAHALLMLKDNIGAIRDSSEAIRLNPDLADAYYARSLAYSNQGRIDNSIRDATTAIEKKPQDADLFHNRGMKYRDALRNVQGTGNQQEESRLRRLMTDDFEKAGQLDPGQYGDDLRVYGQ